MDIAEKRKVIYGAKEWLEYNLPKAFELKNDSYSKLLILATIDCFAQMFGNYPSSNKSNETFCKFVLKYSSQNETFHRVCPVTLRYCYLENYPIKLTRYQIYKWNDPIINDESERILNAIEDINLREIAKRKHSYIKLLYQLRSKLVHELNNIGTKIEFNEEVPSISSGKNIKGEIIWGLNYPRLWLYNLAQETIFNFVEDCLKNDYLLRFLDKERNLDLTWYK